MSRDQAKGAKVQICSNCQPELFEDSSSLGFRLTAWWAVSGVCGVCLRGPLLRARFDLEPPAPKPPEPIPPRTVEYKPKSTLPYALVRKWAAYHTLPGRNNWSISASHKAKLDELSKRFRVMLNLNEKDAKGNLVTKHFREYSPDILLYQDDYFLVPAPTQDANDK